MRMKMRWPNKAPVFLEMLVKHMNRQKKKLRDETEFDDTAKYWFLRGVYKSHKFTRERQLLPDLDLNDRMRLIDQQLIELANQLNVPNRYRDWKLD